jgi:hypothetical protein
MAAFQSRLPSYFQGPFSESLIIIRRVFRGAILRGFTKLFRAYRCPEVGQNRGGPVVLGPFAGTSLQLTLESPSERNIQIPGPALRFRRRHV